MSKVFTTTPPLTLNLYVIYKHPVDYPDDYVVRRFELEAPKEIVGKAKDLDGARSFLPSNLGLYNLGRQRGDEPQIVEVWV